LVTMMREKDRERVQRVVYIVGERGGERERVKGLDVCVCKLCRMKNNRHLGIISFFVESCEINKKDGARLFG